MKEGWCICQNCINLFNLFKVMSFLVVNVIPYANFFFLPLASEYVRFRIRIWVVSRHSNNFLLPIPRNRQLHRLDILAADPQAVVLILVLVLLLLLVRPRPAVLEGVRQLRHLSVLVGDTYDCILG